ncbi:MAG: GTPase ObgE [Gemmatimonadales bacterium]|nr:MAG: GTPase ObgE [Gemmatimonadales bacterium]
MFIDQVTIRVEGGVGGSGADSFRRESFVPRGGPDGGDGGHGGSVILEADDQLATLTDFRYLAEYRAERGQHGMGSNKTGRRGSDLRLRVPPGTLVKDVNADESIGELLEHGDELVVARGGRGGRGNASFATATNQAPRRWEPGGEGVQRTLELTLKLIADVGLVGEPNAGKSTFLSSVSEARPKVAAYPFTTLQPNLGVVKLADYRSFVVADIPGIIEGAAEGKGLGHQFLRHIERTRSLALLVPVDDPDPQETYLQLLGELERYSSELALRPHCLVLTKTDMLGPDDAPPEVHAPTAWGTFAISAVAHQGLDVLLEALWKRVRQEPRGGPVREIAEVPDQAGREGQDQEEAEAEADAGHGADIGLAADGTRLDDEEEWWGGEPL